MKVETRHVIGGDICELMADVGGIKFYSDMEEKEVFVADKMGNIIAKVVLHASSGEGGGGYLGVEKC